ncbi:uncharacterized protein [Euphorbia lathyris]|uniref:uncharacterized protein isoform X2 n=1 Tax=Euphorbia lathyris TaxID=212925 RepID=UPI003313729D
MIKRKLDKNVLTDDDHIHFVWMVLSNYIFERMGLRPTAHILVIAKALAPGRQLALGTILLAHTSHRLPLTDNTYIPLCTYFYMSILAHEDAQWWRLFCATRRLYHVVTKSKNLRSASLGLVLYAPCLWARKLGFFQALSGPLPFPMQPLESEENTVDVTSDMSQELSPLLLSADQPLFDAWWETVYKQCIPPLKLSNMMFSMLRAQCTLGYFSVGCKNALHVQLVVAVERESCRNVLVELPHVLFKILFILF